jgi:hypothetical protein
MALPAMDTDFLKIGWLYNQFTLAGRLNWAFHFGMTRNIHSPVYQSMTPLPMVDDI